MYTEHAQNKVKMYYERWRMVKEMTITDFKALSLHLVQNLVSSHLLLKNVRIKIY
jgi:hypothetical protein